ncbi:cell division protein FtsQ/DivIB [Neptuniibacter marinus]|uniref:cell division protein FtsQ/DivIB n=1 Tax=Neptuniibacter marinus TaxID=1806670 RepID=UPI00082DA40D|nr:cell division protein FtsQ/DivIB [Neptuniibacter marinus]
MKFFDFFKSKKSVQSEDEPVLAPRGASREAVSSSVNKDSKIDVDLDGWWKPFWTISSLIIFIGVVWGVSHNVWKWLDQPVEQIVVIGNAQHLDRKDLAEDIAARLKQGLLSADIGVIQELVREYPWVRVAAIKRDWPNQLIVEIEEEVPVARWGERGLLNHQGDIFWPELKEEYRSLPRLSGPAPETERVMAQFHDFNQMLRQVGLNVVSLNLEARGAWTFELDNQIKVIVGREAIDERLRRFLDLYQLRLLEQVDEIEAIDIRYTHGVAVKWREKAEDENAG